MSVMDGTAESISTSPPFQGDLVLKSSKITRLFSTAAVLGALAVPAVADEEGITLPGASAEVTLDYVTNYWFRGYEQTNGDDGIVLQPGASLTVPVVDDITATIGTWNSYHTNGDSLTGGNNWYEADIYASIDGTAGDFSWGVGLTLYTYPALVIPSVTELGFSLGFDDSAYLGDFAFSPYVYVGLELNNSNAVTLNGGEAQYLEIGGAFSLDSLTEGTFAEAWTWAVPITAGFSINDYYQDVSGSDEFFGYLSVGLAGSVPMSELIGYDEWFGAWDLNVGITALFLNGDIDANLASNDGSTTEFIGSVGLSRGW